MKALLVTGSSGLIGSEVATYFAQRGYEVHGVDNNQRAVFFGAQGDTRWNQHRLQATLPAFAHHEIDVRDRAGIIEAKSDETRNRRLATAVEWMAEGTSRNWKYQR